MYFASILLADADWSQSKIVREIWLTHSVPRFALLRVRRFVADLLALLPRSLSDASWRTFARAGRSPASQRCKDAVC